NKAEYLQKFFCAVNSQSLFTENSFDSSQKITFQQRFFRGSGSVQLRAFYHSSRPEIPSV
ncbi:MAG: hypothetical protein KAR13_17185, partial [Desulfobulbaceae bacterium]|nr:hypothetical protein [Desulfobulbaceae bacterium]